MKELWQLIEKELGTTLKENKKIHNNVQRLSQSFTQARKKLKLNYFSNSQQSRAYLAYYLPLNFEKVCTILREPSPTFWKHSPKLHWIDFGCGPGTASLAALAVYHEHILKMRCPSQEIISIDLIDKQPAILELAERLIKNFAKTLGINVHIRAIETFNPDTYYDLAFAVNVLNELPEQSLPPHRELLLQLWDRVKGAFLVVEPGHRVPSQRLIRFRERLLKEGQTQMLGPCCHSQRCPLYRTKHWCHFSEKLLDSKLLDLNRRIFQNPRLWLKFSYILAKRGTPTPWNQETFRVIGDLHPSGAKNFAIDLCQPKEKLVFRVLRHVSPAVQKQLVRGAVVNLTDVSHGSGWPSFEDQRR